MIFKVSFFKKILAVFFSLLITFFITAAVSHLSKEHEEFEEKDRNKNIFSTVLEKETQTVSKTEEKTEILDFKKNMDRKRAFLKDKLSALNISSTIQSPYPSGSGPGFSLGGGIKKDIIKSMKDTETDVFTKTSVDKAPEIIFKPEMSYPPGARSEGIEGSVTLKIMIGKSGAVKEVVVLNSEPKGVFEKTALKEIKRWRFKPGSYKGRNVRVWVIETVTYKLK